MNSDRKYCEIGKDNGFIPVQSDDNFKFVPPKANLFARVFRRFFKPKSILRLLEKTLIKHFN